MREAFHQRMLRTFFTATVIAVVAFAAIGCAKEPAQEQPAEIASAPAAPAPKVEEYAPLATYAAMVIPEDNPMSDAKIALGHQMFFDARLSGDGSRSCYSCHLNERGLSDGRPMAIGAFEKQLTRNSPTMWNIGYHPHFYWDGRATTLEAQALAAWKGGNMGATEPEKIVAAINAIEEYRTQFQAVFAEDATVDNVPKALAAYMRTIVSGSTPWDTWQAGDDSAIGEPATRGAEAFNKAK